MDNVLRHTRPVCCPSNRVVRTIYPGRLAGCVIARVTPSANYPTVQDVTKRALSVADERDIAKGAGYVVDSCRVLRACQRLLMAKAGVKPNALPVNLADAIARCKKHSLITDLEFHELHALRHRANQQRHQTMWALEPEAQAQAEADEEDQDTAHPRDPWANASARQPKTNDVSASYHVRTDPAGPDFWL